MRRLITRTGVAANESGDDLATVVVYGVHMHTKGDPMKGSLPPDERYHAYLVRLWQDGPDRPWRALIRDSANDEERRFATVEELFLFLHEQTDGGTPHRGHPNPTITIPAALRAAVRSKRDKRGHE